ncbi:MAG: DUF4838 domain-containing protein [Agriterribacter sp.]
MMKLYLILLVLAGHFAVVSLMPEGIFDLRQRHFNDEPKHPIESDYRIVLNNHPSASEKWAAGELQHWLYEISGVYIPVLRSDMEATGKSIFVGYNDAIANKTNAPAPGEHDEAYHYFSDSGNIYIYGGRQRGTMYGVFSFLENEFGCRWYTPSVTVIPKRNGLTFGTYNHKESPGIQVRNNFYFEAFDPVWAARNKMNGRMYMYLPEKKIMDGGFFYSDQPGGVETYWSVHTFRSLLPPAEFFDKHPEYFSLNKGVRSKTREQLCLSNPNVLRLVITRLKEHMQKHPDFRIFCVSQNDNTNPCECDKCQTIVKKEGSEAGIILWFVNQVAAAVEQQYPDKYIGTLAYRYTQVPPKNVRPRKNVVIRLCPIEACAVHDLQSCPQNKSFNNILHNWSSISPQLYIWDYVINFHHLVLPFPNFNVLQPNIQNFRKNKSLGIMEQADYVGRGGEFAELRMYLLSKLLWNPDGDVQTTINDFLTGYYGRSAPFVRQYFDAMHALVTPDVHYTLYSGPADNLFTDKFINEALKLFEAAKQYADNEDILHRVELASLPVLNLKSLRQPALSLQDGTYETLLKIAQREGVHFFGEHLEREKYFKKFMKLPQ